MILNQIDNARLGTDQVEAIYLGQDLVWTNGNGPDYASMYLTIEALEDGDFYVRKANVSYSVNGGAWETTTGETALALNTGDTVILKKSYDGTTLFKMLYGVQLNFKAYGNIMSLAYGDNFIGQTEVPDGDEFWGYFAYLFSDSKIMDVSHIILPATILKPLCYYGMFQGCTSLTTAPELPATTLASACYQSMFSNCTSLTAAPELPATTLVDYCYQNMFYGCTSLTSAPELPATTLAAECYWGMFYGCSSLNYIKCLATDISAFNCTWAWVSQTAATGTFIKKAGVNWQTGDNGIPSGWTVEDAS